MIMKKFDLKKKIAENYRMLSMDNFMFILNNKGESFDSP